MKQKLTQDIVRELLDYNPHSGELTWKWRKRKWFISLRSWKVWNTKYAGKLALTTNKDGYGWGCILYNHCRAHRVIWLWMTGHWPNPEVDHINHNRGDNRWINLREKTRTQNGRNISLAINNTSGHIGVHYESKRELFVAYIKVDQKRYHLGRYPTFEEAVAAREVAERKYGFHVNHGKAVP